jgi:hypothetical protein
VILLVAPGWKVFRCAESAVGTDERDSAHKFSTSHTKWYGVLRGKKGMTDHLSGSPGIALEIPSEHAPCSFITFLNEQRAGTEVR